MLLYGRLMYLHCFNINLLHNHSSPLQQNVHSQLDRQENAAILRRQTQDSTANAFHIITSITQWLFLYQMDPKKIVTGTWYHRFSHSNFRLPWRPWEFGPQICPRFAPTNTYPGHQWTALGMAKCHLKMVLWQNVLWSNHDINTEPIKPLISSYIAKP